MPVAVTTATATAARVLLTCTGILSLVAGLRTRCCRTCSQSEPDREAERNTTVPKRRSERRGAPPRRGEPGPSRRAGGQAAGAPPARAARGGGSRERAPARGPVAPPARAPGG